jgi:hypothetical protein
MAFEHSSDQVKNGSIIKPLLGIEAVIGRPIQLMAVLCAKQAGDGMAPKTHQAAEHVPAAALEGRARSEQLAALVDALFQSF